MKFNKLKAQAEIDATQQYGTIEANEPKREIFIDGYKLGGVKMKISIKDDLEAFLIVNPKATVKQITEYLKTL